MNSRKIRRSKSDPLPLRLPLFSVGENGIKLRDVFAQVIQNVRVGIVRLVAVPV